MASNEHWTSADLLARFCGGEALAADLLFERYAERLLRLARARLSSRLAGKTDPEDVAMSAWRSFYIGARRGQFTLTAPGDLWRLLVSIALHKLYRQARHHAAARRSIAREQSLSQTPEASLTTALREPTAHEAVALADELEAIMANLNVEGRRILELRLQGEQIAAIAQLTDRSERTVRRVLAEIRTSIATRFGSEIPAHRTTFDKLPSAGRPSNPLPSAGVLPASGAVDSYPHLDFRDYLLQRMLGAGRFGKVYRARQRSRDQTVAIKYLRKPYLDSPIVVERFIEEARTLAKLDHPGIVKLHGLGRTPAAHYFIVMDWIDGPDLSKILQPGPVSPARATNWATQICGALAHAHEQGILHCDLKPNNLLVDHDDRIFVTDFGLARPLSSRLELSARIEGTPAFMAPEQVADWWGPITCQTDVYGVGAVLLTLLTGQPPWPGKRPSDILARIISPEPVATDVWRLEIPKPLKQICRRCLAKKPSERPENMNELESALRKCME